jgi:hypothetical protein
MNTMSQGPAVTPANSESTNLLGSAAAPVAIVASRDPFLLHGIGACDATIVG